jgi:phenylacetate-CoA ligase
MNIRLMWALLLTLGKLRRRERWLRPQLEAYQAESLRQLREYAYARSPFYQRFHKGLTDRPLQELPVLTKSTMMEHFDDIITDRSIRLADVRAYVANDQTGRLFLNRYLVNATSGSSGHPGIFLFDQVEWQTILASFARGHEWAGVKVTLTHRMKMASIASLSPWHMSAQVGASLKSWWMPTLRLAASDLPAEIVQSLNAWQPEMLVTYASMARILADEQIAERLRIQPHMVYTSSEVLTEETRRRVHAAWGHEPFNQYASTETANIASECKEGRRLHLYEDLVVVEVVDEQYQPVPLGSCGARLLVTTLFSRTQPLIRYELNDRIRLAPEPCSCGRSFALVESIQGRSEDLLFLPAIAGGDIPVQPLVFSRVMDITSISGWQIIQDADGLTVLVSGAQDGFMDQILMDKLAQALMEQGVRIPHISVQRVDTIPKTAAGKAPLIKKI